MIGIQSAMSFHLIQVAERDMSESRILRMPLNLMFNTWIALLNYYLINKDIFAPGESVISRYGQQLIDHYMNLISLKGGELI